MLFLAIERQLDGHAGLLSRAWRKSVPRDRAAACCRSRRPCTGRSRGRSSAECRGRRRSCRGAR
jgi:hypothetical protein